MANIENKFKVYGQTPNVNNVFPTSENPDDPAPQQSPGQIKYDALYGSGIEPDTLAKAQDVLTPLRELTIFSVSFLNWLAEQTGFDSSIVDFEDATIDPSDPDVTKENLEDMLANIKNALTQALTNKINSKEPIIERNNTDKKGFLKYTGSAWSWDQSTYQTAYDILTSINNYFTNSSNKGFMYKEQNSSILKSTDKQFVYYDSESTDANGNKILNLKKFNYTDN